MTPATIVAVLLEPVQPNTRTGCRITLLATPKVVPPTVALEQSDYGVVTSLGYSF